MNTKKQITKIKNLALECKAKGQLPSYLVFKILNLDDQKDSEGKIKVFMYLTEKYFRVPKFYVKYKHEEEIANEEIKQILKKGV